MKSSPTERQERDLDKKKQLPPALKHCLGQWWPHCNGRGSNGKEVHEGSGVINVGERMERQQGWLAAVPWRNIHPACLSTSTPQCYTLHTLTFSESLTERGSSRTFSALVPACVFRQLVASWCRCFERLWSPCEEGLSRGARFSWGWPYFHFDTGLDSLLLDLPRWELIVTSSHHREFPRNPAFPAMRL